MDETNNNHLKKEREDKIELLRVKRALTLIFFLKYHILCQIFRVSFNLINRLLITTNRITTIIVVIIVCVYLCVSDWGSGLFETVRICFQYILQYTVQYIKYVCAIITSVSFFCCYFVLSVLIYVYYLVFVTIIATTITTMKVEKLCVVCSFVLFPFLSFFVSLFFRSFIDEKVKT